CHVATLRQAPHRNLPFHSTCRSTSEQMTIETHSFRHRWFAHSRPLDDGDGSDHSSCHGVRPLRRSPAPHRAAHRTPFAGGFAPCRSRNQPCARAAFARVALAGRARGPAGSDLPRQRDRFRRARRLGPVGRRALRGARGSPQGDCARAARAHLRAGAPARRAGDRARGRTHARSGARVVSLAGIRGSASNTDVAVSLTRRISTAPPASEAGIVDADARRYGARAWATNGARTRGRIGSTVSIRLKIETENRYWPATSRFAAGCSTERRRPGCARSRSGARLEAIGPSATTATRGGNAAAGIDRGGAPLLWSHLHPDRERTWSGKPHCTAGNRCRRSSSTSASAAG